MLPCQELKIFDHTPPRNQYTRQPVQENEKITPQVVYCEAFTKSSGKNNILSCRERGDDPLERPTTSRPGIKLRTSNLWPWHVWGA